MITDGNNPPASEVDRKLIARVAKLLAMAEGTTNPNEADAFSAKAAALIAEHRIDVTRLQCDAQDPLEVLEVPIGRGAYVRARLALLQAVAEAHGCHVVFGRRAEGTIAYAAGFRSDLRTVELMYNSLHAQAAARMASQRRATPAATQRWRRSFLFGYALQVGELLADAHEAATRHAPSDSTWLPALRDREQRVAEFMTSRFGRVANAKPAAAPSPTGYLDGARAATGADLGRARVGARRALGAGGSR